MRLSGPRSVKDTLGVHSVFWYQGQGWTLGKTVALYNFLLACLLAVCSLFLLSVHSPTGFDNDTVNNPDSLDRTIASTVVRDGSNPSVSSDWFDICNLNQLTPENVPFIGLFVDNSGSMRISTVGTSLALFESSAAEAGFTIRRVVNSAERWIDPFLTDLVPQG